MKKMEQLKGRKLFWLVLSLLLIASLVLVAVAYAAAPDNPGKLDKHKPVHATDVELIKKISVKTPDSSFVPSDQAAQDKKMVKEAATGILGDHPVSGDKYAIVVGISDYSGTVNDLNYCDDDANDMFSVLTSVYGFESDNVYLLLNDSATREAILSAIEDIGDVATDEDEVVFFYSGHGTIGKADDWDEEINDEAIVAYEGRDGFIWDGELKVAFSEFETSRIIFIFDTCKAGGMKDDLEAPGRVIAMATTEGSLAIESASWGGGHGEFSYYFVDEGMLQSKADMYDHDGDAETADVTVEEAFDYANENCQYDNPTIGDYFVNDLLL